MRKSFADEEKKKRAEEEKEGKKRKKKKRRKERLCLEIKKQNQIGRLVIGWRKR